MGNTDPSPLIERPPNRLDLKRFVNTFYEPVYDSCMALAADMTVTTSGYRLSLAFHCLFFFVDAFHCPFTAFHRLSPRFCWRSCYHISETFVDVAKVQRSFLVSVSELIDGTDVRHRLCLVVPPPSRLRHCLCLVFPPPSRLRHCLCLAAAFTLCFHRLRG